MAKCKHDLECHAYKYHTAKENGDPFAK